MACLHGSIWEGLSDPAVRELSDSSAIWKQNILLSISKLNRFNARFFYSLDGTVWENAFLFTVFKDALDGAVRETSNCKEKLRLT